MSSNITRYDFANDPDFVLVESTSKYIKSISSKTLSVAEMLGKYFIRTYGNVAYGTRIYMLQEDFAYYDSHNINGVKLQLVQDEEPEVQDVPENQKEPEVQDVPENQKEPEVGQVYVEASAPKVYSKDTTDLTVVKHIGPKLQETLKNSGYTSLEDLENLTYEEWAELVTVPTQEKFEELFVSLTSLLA